MHQALQYSCSVQHSSDQLLFQFYVFLYPMIYRSIGQLVVQAEWEGGAQASGCTLV